MVITGKHIAAARGLLGLSPSELAEMSSVHPKTILRFENEQHSPRPATVAMLQRALEDRGIEFYNGGDPGVRLFRSKAKKPGTY
ncbi:helix-turn-helix transcriptional regulator [Haliangium sp. UPWRP_2]|uniref:helix-turn-helix domain-containing protein n=1 Tax=Haliangium sp. UPWRP_2 TaxID=1931276 RepID=UPI001304F0B5|nr:helix-turn-helix transcriptional regulator [Haliangium sp. UPWRP_2]